MKDILSLDIFFLFQGEYIVEKIIPDISEEDFKRLVTPLILEYYENEDTHDIQVRTFIYMQMDIFSKILFELLWKQKSFQQSILPELVLLVFLCVNANSLFQQESLQDLALGKNKSRLVELVINLALDRKATHCEKTSRLISDMYGSTLSTTDISQGFHGLLSSLSDLSLDTPEAPSVSIKYASISFSILLFL